MEPAVLTGAFLVGLAGSLHCVGMCGPLAMAVPTRGNRFFSLLSYNSGRIAMYALLGALFGAFGASVNFLESGQRVSLVLGIAIIVLLGIPALIPNWRFTSSWNTRAVKLYGRLARPVFGYRGPGSSLLLGALNGLLPCGLIYISLAGAIASGSALNGAFVMTAVGLGTWPAMWMMMSLRNYVAPWFRRHSRKVVPVVAIALGAVLILRGMNLDIPYLSPRVEKVGTAGQEVCD